MIKAVTIDFWGTLLLDGPGADEDYRRPRLAGLQRVLEGAGIPVSPHDLESAYGHSATHLRRIWQECRDVPVQEHVRAILDGVHPALRHRIDEAVLSALVDAYASPALLVPPAFDHGAKGALEALAAGGLRLCVVSNIMRTPGATLRQLLDRQGLLGLFQVLTFSDECAVRKPAPEIFRLTLERIGVAPAEAVHVGDDAVLDVAGARAAGLRAIHVIGSASPRAALKADAAITELSQLPAALRTLRRR